jgi:beta-1,4-N-acetylglucosaminyltransferase
MDNHQLELAETLEAQNLVVHGHIGSLAAAIHRVADRITQGRLDALPPYTPPSFPVSAADRVTLFDWMVLTCYPDELAAQMHVTDLGLVEAEFAAKQQQQPYQQQGQPIVSGNVPATGINNQEDNGMLQLD